MQIKTVLISGAGIAGTTLAYWLNQYGIEPVVIERAPAFRGGGYMIDFWGLGYELADRMGILPRLKSKGYFIEEVRYVDRSGKRIAGIGQDAIRSILGERYLSILRSDLASQIYETTAGRTEMIFGDSIRSVEQCETGVRVTFERNGPRKFDLLIGADGLHSTVRRIAFGNGPLERFLGYYAASFSVERYPKRDEAAYVSGDSICTTSIGRWPGWARNYRRRSRTAARRFRRAASRTWWRSSCSRIGAIC